MGRSHAVMLPNTCTTAQQALQYMSVYFLVVCMNGQSFGMTSGLNQPTFRHTFQSYMYMSFGWGEHQCPAYMYAIWCVSLVSNLFPSLLLVVSAMLAWYNQCMLKCTHLFSVDIWSVGCIFAEMVRGEILLPGKDCILFIVHVLCVCTFMVVYHIPQIKAYMYFGSNRHDFTTS